MGKNLKSKPEQVPNLRNAIIYHIHYGKGRVISQKDNEIRVRFPIKGLQQFSMPESFVGEKAVLSLTQFSFKHYTKQQEPRPCCVICGSDTEIIDKKTHLCSSCKKTAIRCRKCKQWFPKDQCFNEYGLPLCPKCADAVKVQCCVCKKMFYQGSAEDSKITYLSKPVCKSCISNCAYCKSMYPINKFKRVDNKLICPSCAAGKKRCLRCGKLLIEKISVDSQTQNICSECHEKESLLMARSTHFQCECVGSPLTVLNAGKLGMLDDVQCLYDQICSLYEQHSSETGWPLLKTDFKISKMKFDKLLTPFFAKYHSVFFGDLEYTHFFKRAIGDFEYCFWNRNSPITVYNRCSLSVFLKQLQAIAVRQQCILDAGDYFHSNIRKINATINKNIENALEIQEECVQGIIDAKKLVDVSEIRIYKNLELLSCYQKEHQVEPRYCSIRTSQGQNVVMPIHYCKTCHRAFVGEITFKAFKKEYGRLVIKMYEDGNECTYNHFAGESDLHAFGYNVVAGVLSKEERQEILKTVYDCGYLSYFEICAHIENMIHLFETRETHMVAVQKWRSDLQFLNEYVKSRDFE